MDKTLRFYARGSALVPDFGAMERAVPLRRYIGRKYKEVSLGQWGFVPTLEADAVSSHFNEYVKACKAGDLWAGDLETAEYCGVPFDPSFGGAVAKPAPKPSPKPAPKSAPAPAPVPAPEAPKEKV